MLLLLIDEVLRPVNISFFFSTTITLAQQLFEMFDEVQNMGWYDVICISLPAHYIHLKKQKTAV